MGGVWVWPGMGVTRVLGIEENRGWERQEWGTRLCKGVWEGRGGWERGFRTE